MNAINKNLMKLPRSESMDMIIEKLNELHSGISMKMFQNQAIFNWFSLKFFDLNKEIEYDESRFVEKLIMLKKIVFITLGFNFVQLIKEIALSASKKISFASFWFFFGYAMIGLLTLASIYKI